MARNPRPAIECRDYDLPPDLPIRAITGEDWRISDIRSDVLHFHNCLEIGLCHSDSGFLEFSDARCPFGAGDVTLIASGTPHTTYSAPGQASRWSYLFADMASLVDPAVAPLGPPQVRLYNGRLIVSAKEDPALGVLVEEIVREMTEKKPNYKPAVRGLFDALMCKFFRHVTRLDAFGSDSPMLISPALRYIDSCYMDPFTIEDLAAMCKVSASYFRHVFTETVGVGPLEYLNRTRVIRSCTLLQTTNLSIVEVCEAVGFRSLSSYNRHFSEIMGQPPTAWRRHIHLEQPAAPPPRYSGWLTPPRMEPRRPARAEKAEK